MHKPKPLLSVKNKTHIHRNGNHMARRDPKFRGQSACERMCCLGCGGRWPSSATAGRGDWRRKGGSGTVAARVAGWNPSSGLLSVLGERQPPLAKARLTLESSQLLPRLKSGQGLFPPLNLQHELQVAKCNFRQSLKKQPKHTIKKLKAQNVPSLLFKRFYLFNFRERVREGERG